MTAAILTSIAQSMIALLLAGALLLPLFSRPQLEEGRKTQLLVGAIFGVTFAALSLNSIVVEDGGVLNATAGVLIFAAYLGGPIAGILTLMVALAIRAGFGGNVVALGLIMQTAYVIGGLLLRRIKPFSSWPKLPDGILLWALGVFLLMHLTVIMGVRVLGVVPFITPIASEFVVFTLAAALSITVTCLVVQHTWRLATIERENRSLLQQLQLIFENCGIGVFRYNGLSNRLELDRSFLKLYGLSEDDALHPGSFTDRMVHPDDRDVMQGYIRNAIAGHLPRDTHQFRVCQNDDQIRYMRSNWQLESVTSAGVRSFIGLHVDVTDVTMAHQRRTEAEQQIAAIAENLPGIIFQVIWQEGHVVEVVYISPKTVDFWGLSQQALYENPGVLSNQFEEGEEDKVRAALDEAAGNNHRGFARVWMRGPANNRIGIELQLQAMARGDGTHLVNGIFIDVTNEFAAQEEADLQAALARQAQKTESIGRLTGGVAHDFNNILAIILSNLELLRDTVETDSQRAMIDAGIGASHRGAGLTRSMLSFARTARLDPEVLDLNTVVRHAKNWMRRAVPESVKVEMSLLAGLWPVKLDASSLESALLNLIVNARDAMDNHGNLTIETANVRIDESYLSSHRETIAPGRYVMLAVSDTGSGIDAETLEHMFEPFYTTKPQGLGSGIGLSMVQGFVKQSLGTIEVYTEPGKGTSFKIYFPVSDAESMAERAIADAPINHEKGDARILLVEDDEDIRAVQLTMLQSAGYHVVTARNGDAALAVFNTDQSFDLIVTDIIMPGELQGTTLAEQIRTTHPEMPFVFMSGYAAESIVHGGGLNPDDVRLMKPVPMSTFLNAIADAL